MWLSLGRPGILRARSENRIPTKARNARAPRFVEFSPLGAAFACRLVTAPIGGIRKSRRVGCFGATGAAFSSSVERVTSLRFSLKRNSRDIARIVETERRFSPNLRADYNDPRYLAHRWLAIKFTRNSVNLALGNRTRTAERKK